MQSLFDLKGERFAIGLFCHRYQFTGKVSGNANKEVRELGGGDGCNTGRHKQTRARGRTPCHEEDSRCPWQCPKDFVPSETTSGF